MPWSVRMSNLCQRVSPTNTVQRKGDIISMQGFFFCIGGIWHACEIVLVLYCTIEILSLCARDWKLHTLTIECYTIEKQLIAQY
jgi:hypothetical protein